jgi:hypothetical protein
VKASKAESPVAAIFAADGALKHEQLATALVLQDTLSPLSLQIRALQRAHGMTRRQAELVAVYVFGESAQ